MDLWRLLLDRLQELREEQDVAVHGRLLQRRLRGGARAQHLPIRQDLRDRVPSLSVLIEER
jgi:hypothetical protein